MRSRGGSVRHFTFKDGSEPSGERRRDFCRAPEGAAAAHSSGAQDVLPHVSVAADPAKLVANSRLSVQIASKLPLILTTMPPCVLSPGLVDDTLVGLEDGGNVSSVFYHLFRLFEELLGWAVMRRAQLLPGIGSVFRLVIEPR